MAQVIDSDYRGNIMVHLWNHSKTQTLYFDKGDKVAQGVVVPVWTGVPKQVESISTETERGEGGFGSTGK